MRLRRGQMPQAAVFLAGGALAVGAILFLLFLAVPLIEIALFIGIGGQIGLLPTLALTVFTAVLGAGLLKAQGVSTAMRVRQQMAQGQMPVDDVLGGMFLAVAGALLLTPGFFTDAIGFALFVPGVRRALARMMIERGMKAGRVHMHHSGFGHRPSAGGRGTVVDGDFEDVTPGDRSGGEADAPSRWVEGPDHSPDRSKD